MKKNISKYFIEIWGWLGIILFTSAIWIPEYRWRLFFTAVISWGLAIGSYISDESKKNELRRVRNR